MYYLAHCTESMSGTCSQCALPVRDPLAKVCSRICAMQLGGGAATQPIAFNVALPLKAASEATQKDVIAAYARLQSTYPQLAGVPLFRIKRAQVLADLFGVEWAPMRTSGFGKVYHPPSPALYMRGSDSVNIVDQINSGYNGKDGKMDEEFERQILAAIAAIEALRESGDPKYAPTAPTVKSDKPAAALQPQDKKRPNADAPKPKRKSTVSPAERESAVLESTGTSLSPAEAYAVIVERDRRVAAYKRKIAVAQRNIEAVEKEAEDMIANGRTEWRAELKLGKGDPNLRVDTIAPLPRADLPGLAYSESPAAAPQSSSSSSSSSYESKSPARSPAPVTKAAPSKSPERSIVPSWVDPFEGLGLYSPESSPKPAAFSEYVDAVPTPQLSSIVPLGTATISPFAAAAASSPGAYRSGSTRIEPLAQSDIPRTPQFDPAYQSPIDLTGDTESESDSAASSDSDSDGGRRRRPQTRYTPGADMELDWAVPTP